MPRILGQHFLKDQKALRKIIAALEITPRDTIVEVGPGHGELTKYLLEADPKKIIAIEKDRKLAESFKENFQLSSQPRHGGVERIRVNSKPSAKSQFAKLEIIEGDALKVLPILNTKCLMRDTNYKLVGNIPYYITGHLLRKISELEEKPKLIVFTIQKEVAERICAAPPRMNLLAASVQFWGTPKIVGYISKRSVRPPPKVNSAIIKITPSSQPRYSGVERIRMRKTVGAEEYYKFVKILFKQPRKTILNNLRAGLKAPEAALVNALDKAGIKPGPRPQNLSIKDIQAISRVFRQLKEL